MVLDLRSVLVRSQMHLACSLDQEDMVSEKVVGLHIHCPVPHPRIQNLVGQGSAVHQFVSICEYK